MIGAALVMILMFGLTIALVKIDTDACKLVTLTFIYSLDEQNCVIIEYKYMYLIFAGQHKFFTVTLVSIIVMNGKFLVKVLQNEEIFSVGLLLTTVQAVKLTFIFI